jgi:serine/threonine-protein kinase
MLRASDRDADALRDAVGAAATTLPADAPARIGPFRVLRRLGAGGMGAVYLCRRDDADFEQLLAIKRLAAAAGSAFARERLRAERRVLATLRHPHIAQLVDGGEDADGTPFVAMEYVDGVPITDYAAQHHLDLRARVGLFGQLCAAVQFAHRNLVVHRDLKPDNVLVDGHGQVKLLDFGIAKLLGEHEAGNATPTVAGAMTPHYASPEQVRGEPVSQASDIYSLGVLLYELLCGRRPYAIETTRPSEIERIVCTLDPAPPCAAAGIRGRAAADLDCIVLRAMHKEAERRYASAAQFADDLQRWLERRPVTARPDSTAYRLASFVRRHPLGVALSAVSVVVLAGFAVAMAWQARELARQRDVALRESRVARETADFLVELFAVSDPRERDPADLRAVDLLDVAAQRLPDALSSDPLARARLMHVIGLAYANVGDDARGTALLAQALALREQHAGSDSAEVADSLNRLGNIHRQFGRLREAEPMLLRALAWRERQGEIDADLADSYNNVGLVQNDLGRHVEAEATLRHAIALHRAVSGADTADAASSLHNLAIALRAQGRAAEAHEAALESLRLKRASGARNVSIATTEAVLANIETELGQLDAALTHASESLATRRSVYGNDSAMIASGLVTLARVHAARGEADAARPLFEEALALHARTGNEQTLAAANAQRAFGSFLVDIGERERAVSLLTRARDTAVTHLPADSAELRRYDDALRAAGATP